MRLVRFRWNHDFRWGVMDNKDVWTIRGSVYGEFDIGKRVGSMDTVELLPPCELGKVVALAYNYKDLVGERNQYDEPLFFLKSPTSVIGSRSPIVIPSAVSRVWAEVELAFVVKREARHVAPENGGEYILGYTIANDVTASNIHERDHHLARSKALDTFCPVGSVLHTDLVTSDLRMSTRINGRVTQRGSTANRILNDAEALSLISQFVTLHPGDLVLTGTPAGAMDSLIHPGDEAILEIEGLGQLTNPIIADQQWEEQHG